MGPRNRFGRQAHAPHLLFERSLQIT
jgi:hypothetical protein